MNLLIHKLIFLLGMSKEAMTTNQSAPNIPPTTVGENFTVRTLKEAITTNKSAPNIPPAAVAENVIEFMHTNITTSNADCRILGHGHGVCNFYTAQCDYVYR
mgnify:CR=1 FL=1